MGNYTKGFLNRNSVSCEGVLGDFLGKIFKTHSEFTDPNVKLWKRLKEANKVIQSAKYAGEISFSTDKLIIDPTPKSIDAWLEDGKVIGGWNRAVLAQTEKLFNLLYDIEQEGWSEDDQPADNDVGPVNSSEVVRVFKEIKLPPRPFKSEVTLKSGLTIEDVSDKPPYCKVGMPKITVREVSLTAKNLKELCAKLKDIATRVYTGSDGYSANGQHEKIMEYTDTQKMILHLKNAKFNQSEEQMVREVLTSVCSELGMACQLDNLVGVKVETSVGEFLCTVADTIRSKHVQ